LTGLENETDGWWQITYVEILVEVNGVLALVESRLLAHKLPVQGGLLFETLVVEDLPVVGLHYDVLNHEFWKGELVRK
jgi:hypothetical protein